MASDTAVRIDQRALQALVDQGTAQLMAVIGNRIVNAAKARANVDTGLMRSRIEFRLEPGSSPPVGTVDAYTSYAKYVHRINPFLTDAARDVMG